MLISLDLVKAFDSVSTIQLARYVLLIADVSLRLKFALVKEIVRPKWVAFVGLGPKTDYVRMFSGIRQGSPEASLLFAMFINYHLTLLASSWEERNLSFCFGEHKGRGAMRLWIDEYINAWNHADELMHAIAENLKVAVLAFVDDLVLASNSVASAQIMLN